MPRYGRGRRRRGRHRGKRRITELPRVHYFRPYGPPSEEIKFITLSLGELEAIRLVDLHDFTQEEAAAQIGVSRKTLWNDLHKARQKIAQALIEGHAIRIEEKDYNLK